MSSTDPTKPDDRSSTPPDPEVAAGRPSTADRSPDVPAVAVMSALVADAVGLGPPPRPGLLGSIDRFEVLRLLGRGGMGVVYLARDPASGGGGRLVAIKTMSPPLARQPQAVHRFLIEVRHMSRLSHRNILPMLEVGERPDGPYFVMPYLERGSLARLIQPGQPIDPMLAKRIGRGLAEALQFAHEKGITHRDLKPDNVLLDEAGDPLLTDFGLSRTVFNDSIVDVRSSLREGTAAYMAPEIARGEAGDTRCDIYSWGALLYEMLTGRPPYEGDAPQELLRQIIETTPRPISERNPQAPTELAKIADGAMARDLAERYASMGHVVQDLQRVEHGSAPLGPHGSRRSGGEAERRSRLILMTAASVAIALLVTVASIAWILRKPKAQPAPVVEARPVPALRLVRELSTPIVPDSARFLVGHFNTDQRKDLFALSNDARLLVVVSGENERLLELFVGVQGCMDLGLSLIADMDNSSDEEYFLRWAVPGRAQIARYNSSRGRKDFGVDAPLYSIRQEDVQRDELSHLDALGVRDLDGDGRRELIAALGTARGKRPRQVLAFSDDAVPRVIWRREIGPKALAEPAQFIDLDDDGRLDLLVGSYACANGNQADDGTNDEHSYIYAIRHDGALLWHARIDGAFTAARPVLADLDRDGRPEICVWSEGSYGHHDAGRIVVLDRKGVQKHAHQYDAALNSCLPADIDRDGEQELLATDRRGLLYIFDEDLKPGPEVKIIDAPGFAVIRLMLHAAADLDGDGTLELLMTSGLFEQTGQGAIVGQPTDKSPDQYWWKNEVLVVTADLNVAARYLISEQWENNPNPRLIVDVFDRSRQPRILVLFNKAELLEYATK
ncbi:protein kinase domain-containing protein [Fontivita pretiosa]|uniref:serine/threonine protein kinase n=1 Tax=Fontivita pretiosa TaxID=2989684 RepID=UPI003D187200